MPAKKPAAKPAAKKRAAEPVRGVKADFDAAAFEARLARLEETVAAWAEAKDASFEDVMAKINEAMAAVPPPAESQAVGPVAMADVVAQINGRLDAHASRLHKLEQEKA